MFDEYRLEKMDSAKRGQILDEAVCILRRTNTLGEKYEPNYSRFSYEQIVGQLGLFNCCMTAGLGEGKLFWFL